MELNELKNAWVTIDERLKKQEILNTRMVQEMLRDKSTKSLNKLINLEVFSIIVLLLAIPLCIYLANYTLANTFFPRITMIVCVVVCVFGIIGGWYTLKNYFLKIDFSNSIKDNMQYVNKYNVLYRKGKMINYCIIIPAFSLLGMLSYYELKSPFYLWIFLFVTLTIAIGITYWTYKKVYETNIHSIQKSLEELSELEEK